MINTVNEKARNGNNSSTNLGLQPALKQSEIRGKGGKTLDALTEEATSPSKTD